MHRTLRRLRPILLTALMTTVAAVAIAACGSSSSSSKTSSSTSTTSAASRTAQLASFRSCLKSHGVKTSGHFPGHRGGRPPSGGTPPSGSGTPPAGGFAGGGKQQQAFRACSKDLPRGGFGGRFARGARGGAHFSSAELEKFTACVKQHGYTLPKPNTSGKGAVFPRSIESNKKFQTAAKPCQSLLRPTRGGAPPAG